MYTVHGSRGHQSQYMNDSYQHQLESEIRQRKQSTTSQQSCDALHRTIYEARGSKARKRLAGSKARNSACTDGGSMGSGPWFLYFFQTIFKVRFQKPFPGNSFFFGSGQARRQENLQSRRALPEGRARFSTLTRRCRTANGTNQENRSLSWDILRKAFPRSKGGDFAQRLMRGKVR